jgi:ABC-2 type transport system ATP-binding protein
LDAVVETHKLTKRFRGMLGKGVLAVDELDLTVPRGAVVGLLGPNGAGKTTSIQMVLGNVYPTSGTATVFGMRVGDPAAKRRLGFMPEKFQFHDFLSAEELLHFHGRLAGMHWTELRPRTEQTLELVGLWERRHSKIREFSKGMQQRIGLAQAILHEPDLVVLDEPTSALDPIGRRDVRNIIGHLRERGTTVLLNSHLLSEVELSCDTVAIMHKGRVVRQGTLDDLLTTRSIVQIEAQEVSDETLGRISEFATINSRSGDRLTVTVTADENIPALAEVIVSTHAKLMQMTYQRESLEDFFIRTIKETGESPGN